jgi:hypothetical protein
VRYSVLSGTDAHRGTLLNEPALGSWTSIGDDVVIWSEGKDWSNLVRSVRTSGLLDATPIGREAEGSLHLVIQVGNCFRMTHPEARVILDRGRYLIADLKHDEVNRFADPGEVCWTIRALPRNSAITERARPVQRAADPAITALLSELAPNRYRANLEHLASFHTRHSLSTEFLDVVTWAITQFEALGYTVTTESFAVGSGTSRNVIAERRGMGTGPNDLYVVTAHLDSINLAGGPSASAPGADDNGSGSAAVLEIAVVLSTTATQHDLRFILFGGEEEGLFGSKHHVANLSPQDKARIRAVLNMDMIATRNGTPSPTVLLEGAALSQGFMNSLAESAATYTTLTVQTSLNPFGSDHVPFLNALIPAVLTIEGSDSANTNIHTANDTLAHIDYALAEQILRMNIAAVATAAVIGAAASARTAGQIVSWEPGRLDVFMLGTNMGLFHKWFDGGWGPSITDYEFMGGICTSQPETVSWEPGRLDVFVTGTDRALYHKWFDGGWGPSLLDFEYMGGICRSSPRVVSWGPGRLDVFVVGTDGALYHKWFDGSWGPSVTDYEYLGVNIQGTPKIVSWGSGRLDIFVVGLDSALYHKWFDGGWGPSITDWEYMGGAIYGDVEAVSWAAGRLDVFALGTDQALYHKWFDGSWGPSLTGYEYMGGICTSSPKVVSWAPGRLDVFVTGTDSALYHKWFDGGWGPSITDYEYMGGIIIEAGREAVSLVEQPQAVGY